jgi:hypothetical protein
MRKDVLSAVGFAGALLLAAWGVSAIMFGRGLGGPGQGLLGVGGVIWGLSMARLQASESEEQPIPEISGITSEEALSLTDGDPIRDGQEVLTVKDVERDKRRSTRSTAIVVAEDRNGKEWGLLVTDNHPPEPAELERP